MLDWLSIFCTFLAYEQRKILLTSLNAVGRHSSNRGIVATKQASLFQFWSYLRRGTSFMWAWTGGSPTSASLPPYPHFPPPPPRPPASLRLASTSLPFEYFSRPHRKNKRSSHHITFHFRAWIIVKALRL